jgi:N-methylhydantoinase B
MTENVLDAPVAASGGNYDKVEAEIVRKALVNLTNEMALALINTSGSPVVFEVKDFCTCLLDTNGEHLSYSSYALLHAGSAYIGTKATIDQIEADGTEVRPGDAWILNDPIAAGAAHQGDIAVVTPVFAQDTHLGWCYTSMHVMDVGGTGVSGYAPGAHYIYDEGLLFPPTRAITQGRIDPEWERFVRTNVRLPGIVISDIRSMMAANNVGQQKLQQIVEQFGIEKLQRYSEINKDLTEQTFRRRIEAMRDGVYETTEWIEFDGHGGPAHLLELALRLEVDGSDLRFSFTGVPQFPAFINAGEGVVYGQTMTVLLTTLAYGDLPFNQGMWRPLHIDTGEPGTIVNPVVPAAASNGHTEVGFRIAKGVKDLIVQALALSEDPVVRGRVAAQPQDGFPIAGLTGLDHAGDPTIVFLLDNSVGAGGPATSVGDGQDVYFLSSGTGAGLAQIETHESRQPILFLWRRLMANSGGPGQHRGGQSLDEAYQLRFSEQLEGSATNSCAEVPPRGFGGGLPASTGDYWPVYETNADAVIASGRNPTDTQVDGREEHVASKCGSLTIARGDIMRLHSGGGGGMGDPLLRDPERVAKDVDDEYVTAENAKVAYGVVLTGDGRTVDVDATAACRAEIRAARIGGAPSKEQGAPATIGVSVTLGAADTTWACAYCASELNSVSENWRQAAVTVVTTVSDYFDKLGSSVRRRQEKPDLQVAEHACPQCAGLLGVDVYPDGYPGFPAPRIDGSDPGPLTTTGS